MATGEQLKALIRSHFSDDSERFFTSALQIAAHEAGRGHGELAHDIREIVDKARQTRGAAVLRFPKEMQGLVLAEKPDLPVSSLVVEEAQLRRIERVLTEFEQQDKLKQFGLSHRRKLLLVGPPGTGKTMTARILAHELHLTLFTIQVDRLVTKFMGETAAEPHRVFWRLRVSRRSPCPEERPTRQSFVSKPCAWSSRSASLAPCAV